MQTRSQTKQQLEQQVQKQQEKQKKQKKQENKYHMITRSQTKQQLDQQVQKQQDNHINLFDKYGNVITLTQFKQHKLFESVLASTIIPFPPTSNMTTVKNIIIKYKEMVCIIRNYYLAGVDFLSKHKNSDNDKIKLYSHSIKLFDYISDNAYTLQDAYILRNTFSSIKLCKIIYEKSVSLSNELIANMNNRIKRGQRINIKLYEISFELLTSLGRVNTLFIDFKR